MIETKILSGIEVSRKIYGALEDRIRKLKSRNIVPNLAVILVGNNPASAVYVNSKKKKFNQLKLKTKTFHLDVDTSEEILLNLINTINLDEKCHGILVQLPLPEHVNTRNILWAIEPKKDVDGFHPENVGLLSIGQPRFIPCTPKGIIRILEHEKIFLNGKHVVVIGRSNIVGRPISILTSLKNNNSNGTTTLCHSATSDMGRFTKQADVIISAIGRPNYITGSMIKSNSVLIDVGINRVKDTNNKKGYKLVGDIEWNSIDGIAQAATPVPGGVGPMTIAMLVENTVEAAEKSLLF